MLFLQPPIFAFKEVFEEDCWFSTAFAEGTLANKDSTLYIGPSVVEIMPFFVVEARKAVKRECLR